MIQKAPIAWIEIIPFFISISKADGGRKQAVHEFSLRPYDGRLCSGVSVGRIEAVLCFNENHQKMEENLLQVPASPSSDHSTTSFPYPVKGGSQGVGSLHSNYDLETKGNYLKFLLNNLYRVNESIILGKVYQVAPWRTGRYLWKSQRTFLFQLKLVSHILLIAFLSCLLLFINNQYGSYYRGMSMITCGYFVPKNYCNYDQCVGYLTNQANSLEDYTCSLYKVKSSAFVFITFTLFVTTGLVFREKTCYFLFQKLSIIIITSTSKKHSVFLYVFLLILLFLFLSEPP
jgi:hypothetical protein